MFNRVYKNYPLLVGIARKQVDNRYIVHVIMINQDIPTAVGMAR
jgi:hypothetical protein